MQIGIAGLGKMGSAIAQRLIEVGHDLTVWNRSPEKARPLANAGAKVAPHGHYEYSSADWRVHRAGNRTWCG